MRAGSGLIAVLGIAIWLGSAQPTLAQNDSAAIKSCLEKNQDGSLGHKCIGMVADPCMAAADGDPARTRACATRELRAWEAQLDAALKRIQAGGFPDMKEAVRKSQESWTASVRALCGTFDKIDPGMMPGGAVACAMHATASRALLLRRLGEAVSEH